MLTSAACPHNSQAISPPRPRADTCPPCPQVASSAPPGDVLLVVGHNGPTGLGARPYDLCGMDFVAAGGDHGDPDLEVRSSWTFRAVGPPYTGRGEGAPNAAHT